MTLFFWLKSNYKLVLAGLLIAGSFMGGWWVNGWRHDAAMTAALAEQNAQLVAKYTGSMVRLRQANEAEIARGRALAQANAAMRERNAILQEEIRNANLADTRAAAEVDAEGNYTCPTPLADRDFIRLWNQAASGDSR